MKLPTTLLLDLFSGGTIKNQSRLFHIFLSNRISEKVNLTDISNWHPVSAWQSCRSYFSRNADKWTKRFSFMVEGLCMVFSTYRILANYDPTFNSGKCITGDKKQTFTLLANKQKNQFLILKYSSLTYFKRIVAYYCRFINNCKTK